MTGWKTYDVFISHAVEDRKRYADPLVEELRRHGIRVWYSRDELELGGSLSELVERGMRRSRAALILASKDYFGRHWTGYERQTLFAMLRKRPDAFFIVRCGMTHEELVQHWPEVSDICTIAYTDDLAPVTERLAAPILARRRKTRRKMTAAASLVLLLMSSAVFGYRLSLPDGPVEEMLIAAIEQRIDRVHWQLREQQRAKPGLNPNQVLRILKEYEAMPARNDHAQHFDDGYTLRSTLKDIRPLLRSDSRQPEYFFALHERHLKLLKGHPDSCLGCFAYLVLNRKPLKWEAKAVNVLSDSTAEVLVEYEQPVRGVSVELSYNGKRNFKEMKTHYYGFPQMETLLLSKEKDKWVARSAQAELRQPN